MKWTQQQKFSRCCSSYLEQSSGTFALALHHQRTQLVWLEKPPLPAGLKKVKVAHTQLPSVGFRSWSRFLVVSLQVTWVINPAVGCHYFPPGPQLPSQPLRGLLPISLLGEQRHDVNSLPKTVTRQRCCCDLNLGPSALESSILITRLPSHTPAGLPPPKPSVLERIKLNWQHLEWCLCLQSTSSPYTSAWWQKNWPLATKKPTKRTKIHEWYTGFCLSQSSAKTNWKVTISHSPYTWHHSWRRSAERREICQAVLRGANNPRRRRVDRAEAGCRTHPS